MPILSMLFQCAARTRERSLCVANAALAPQTGPYTPKDLQSSTSATDKRVEDSLVFLLCCSNRVEVFCDSRGHFDDIATIHGQEDGMAKKATTAKAKKPAAKKPAAKKTAAKTTAKKTTAAKRKPAAKKK